MNVAETLDAKGTFVFIFLLQIREAFRGRPEVVLFFSTFATIVWINWVVKTLISRRYEPWTEPYAITASVVIPVVDEPLDLFYDVLQRIMKADPFEVLVVINGKRNEDLENVCLDVGVEWIWTAIPGKRHAVELGVAHVTGEIVVLVDSDTIWTETALDELMKPFADQRVGGVTTNQRILDARRTFITRWADWMENSRVRYSMPAQSVLGQVGCLPGRTIAFRRSILERVMPDFMGQEFLGVFLEVSDDRTLTNLTLKEGYRTVFQSTALVYTDAPLKYRKLYKQQLRWARGSQYNTLRMLPWMVGHAPVLAYFFFTDILLPFMLVGAVIGWAYRTRTGTGVNFASPLLEAHPGPAGWALVAGLIIGGSILSMWCRQFRHLVDVPRDLLWMPAYILFSTGFLMPIRVMGFFRMAHAAGWGTRTGAYAGGRHFNPQVVIPYLLGFFVIGAEFALIVRVSNL